MIEVMLATTLTAALMVALMAVVGSVRFTSREDTDGFWQDRLVQLIRDDLTQSRTMRRGQGRLILVGYASLPHRAPAWRKRPTTVVPDITARVQVEYRLEEAHGSRGLIRIETWLDDVGDEKTPGPTWSAAVFRGLKCGPQRMSPR